MRITKIAVKGLFGMFDHEIPLNQESRITIVHGPNGVGKTVLMRMVHGLFHYDYRYLRKIPFERFRVWLSDGGLISVTKDADERSDGGMHDLVMTFDDGTGKLHDQFVPSETKEGLRKEIVEDRFPAYKLIQVPGEEVQHYWYPDTPTFQVFTWADLLRKHPEIHTAAYGELPAWYARVLETVETCLISTLRIKSEIEDELGWALRWIEHSEGIYLTPRDAVSVVGETYDGLARDLKDAKARLDENPSSVAELNDKLAKLNQFMAEIDNALSLDDVAKNPTASSILRKLRTYIDQREHFGRDLNEVLIDRDFVLRGELLLDIINERFLYKRLQLAADENSKAHGFIGKDGGWIPWSLLSSGEQNLFVLYDRLLLLPTAETLVMIDEPEISMNVVWQRNFLKDLQRIVELRKFDILIATHSPMIIHDKWDWVVHLGAKVDD